MQESIDISRDENIVESHHGQLSFRQAWKMLRSYRLADDAPVFLGDSTGSAKRIGTWAEVRRLVARLGHTSPDEPFRFRAEPGAEREHIAVDYIAVVKVSGILGLAFAGECNWD
jgi:hypothetical protein